MVGQDGRRSAGGDIGIRDFEIPKVGGDAASQIRGALAAVSTRRQPNAQLLQRWFLIGNVASTLLWLVAAAAGYADLHNAQPAAWGHGIVMLLPPAMLTSGLVMGTVGVPDSPFGHHRYRLNGWNVAARLLRLPSVPRTPDHDDLFESPPFGCLFALGGLSFIALVVLGIFHMRKTASSRIPLRHAPADISLGVTLFLAGMLVEIGGYLVIVRLYRRWLIVRACWGDTIVWSLLSAALVIDAIDCSDGLQVSAIRPARVALLVAARQIETDPVAVAAVGLRDLKGRREARRDHLRIAALVRSHADALLHAHDAHDFDRIRTAVVGEFRAACVGKWGDIIQVSPAADRRQRIGWLKKVAPAVALTIVALVAPHVPGFAAAAGFRIPLLLTAVLAFLSGNSPAADVIKDAAGKGIVEAGAKRT